MKSGEVDDHIPYGDINTLVCSKHPKSPFRLYGMLHDQAADELK